VSRKYILVNEEPIEIDDLIVWAKWFEAANRQLARTEVNGVSISTVFLGIDHSFSYADDGLPVLWETLVFGGKLNGECQRYISKDEALIGHSNMVTVVVAENNFTQAK